MLGSGASFIELRRESEPGAGLRVSGRGATRLAPAASLEPSSIFSAKLEACTTRAIQSLDWEMTDRQAQGLFGTRFLDLNTTPLHSQSEVRGSRRRVAPPALAKSGE